MSKPNILFLFTDDQRFDTIGALGNPNIQTPNYDRLVSAGTSFTQAHIPGGTSGAVCMPSRAMLHTGRTLFHLKGPGSRIPEEHTLMGEHLRANGYRTFGTGKWHNSDDAYQRSFTDGAEIFFGGMADHWNVPVCDFDPTGESYKKKHPVCVNAGSSKEVKMRPTRRINHGKHSSELLADAAVSFIDGYSDEDPFFMYVSFLAPHDPRVMPQEYLDMYDPEQVDLPESFVSEHPFAYGVQDIRDEVLAAYPRTEAEVREHIRDYYAMITHLDAQIGRILDSLDASGRGENTIVVLAGDNGLAVGRHGLMGKQNLYDHSVRVPLIVSGPDVPAGEQRDAFVYLLDIFPSLCELTGLDIPASVEGKSFVPVLRDPGAEIREDLYLAYTCLCRGVRTRTHKLIEYAYEGNRWTQLFDLDQDPQEMKNLAEDPAQTDLLESLRARMREMRDDWDDHQEQWGGAFWQACG